MTSVTVKAATVHVVSNPGSPKVTVSATPPSGIVPFSSTLSASVSGGVGPYSYQWTNGSQVLGTSSSVSVPFNSAGTFNINLLVTDSAGATANASVLVSATSPSPLQVSASSTRTSGVVPLPVTLNSVVSGGVAPYSYSWKLGATVQSTSSSFSTTLSNPGTFAYVLTVTDSKGAVGTATATVTANAPAPLQVSVLADKTSGQAPLLVNFSSTVSGGVAPYSYSWLDQLTGAVLSTSSSFSAYLLEGSNSVVLTVTDAAGNTQTGTVTVTVSPASALSIVAIGNPTSGTAPLSVQFSSAVSGGTLPYTYSWALGGGVISTQANFSRSLPNLGSSIITDTVTLTVTDSAGNKGTATVVITVQPTAGTASLGYNKTSGAVYFTPTSQDEVVDRLNIVDASAKVTYAYVVGQTVPLNTTLTVLTSLFKSPSSVQLNLVAGQKYLLNVIIGGATKYSANFTA